MAQVQALREDIVDEQHPEVSETLERVEDQSVAGCSLADGWIQLQSCQQVFEREDDHEEEKNRREHHQIEAAEEIFSHDSHIFLPVILSAGDRDFF